jgi:D-3-phosphoglycerate dehydrogenase
LSEGLDSQALVEGLSRGYKALGIRSKTHVTREILEQAPELEAIGAFCIGTNQIDLKSATIKGIPVFNAPYSNTRSVAELVLSEMIALSRQVMTLSSKVHKGDWQKTAQGSFEIRGKTVGIIGYGHIGTQIGLLCEALGMNILYYDIEAKLPLGNARPCSTLKELLSKADFITLHVPETPDTKMMMTKSQFSQMKKGSYFINASRGTVANIKDLAEALKSGHLAGAAIDVFPKEPRKNGPYFESELCGLENVILTPHIGGSTKEAQVSIGKEVATSLDKYFRLGDTLGAVNSPKLRAFEIQEGVLRLCHIHKNIPGVLAKVNTLFSKYEVNIRYQKLGTFEEVGYLIMDFDAPQRQKFEDLYSAVKEEDFTIKARVLKS